MKKFFIGLVLFFIAVVVYLYYNQVSFTPLKNAEFNKLFDQYKGGAKKICSIDFLGTNFKSELFEIYHYKITGVKADSAYPAFKGIWENKSISKETINAKWKPCPANAQTMDLFRFVFTANDLTKEECCKDYNNELKNPGNFYSYVYFSELEHYFLLYCPAKSQLYYLRRRGF